MVLSRNPISPQINKGVLKTLKNTEQMMRRNQTISSNHDMNALLKRSLVTSSSIAEAKDCASQFKDTRAHQYFSKILMCS